MSVNRAILIGRLGGDPHAGASADGHSFCHFQLATSEKTTGENGESQEKTQWHKIVVWGQSAEFCTQYLKKGSLVYVEGKMETRSFKDNNNVQRYITEVITQKVESIGAGSGGSGGNSGGNPGGSPGGAPQANEGECPW